MTNVLDIPPPPPSRFASHYNRSLQLHKEKKEQFQLIPTLVKGSNLRNWVSSFAPFANDVRSAVVPIVKLVCHVFEWPYAEVWKVQESGVPCLKIEQSFFYSFQHWHSMKRYVDRLQRFNSRHAINVSSDDVVAQAYLSQRHEIGQKLSGHDGRRRLLRQLSLHKSLAIPLFFKRKVTHVVVFHGNSTLQKGQVNFLLSALRHMTKMYEHVEDIESDEEEEGQETTTME